MLNLLRNLLLMIKFPESLIWLAEIAFILFLTIAASYSFRRLYIVLHRKLRHTENSWDTAIALALKKPIMLAIWIIGFIYIIKIISEESQIALFNEIERMKAIIVSLGFLWFIFRFTNHMTKILVIKHRRMGRAVDLTTADAIAKVIKAVVVVTVILVLMDHMGVSLSGILAFGGFSGIAIGFAAKDLLSNFFGALVIYMDKPFAVGDWIQSPDRNIRGTVEYIGWRQTRIRTFDKRPIYVPNSILGTVIIENPSRMTHRRIDETISIRYEDVGKMEKITEEIKGMLQKHRDINPYQTMFVNFDHFGAHSLNIRVYTFTKTTNWVKFQEVKQDVFLKIVDIIESNGAKLALPHSVINVKDEVNLNLNKPEDREEVLLHYHDENGHAH